VELCSALKVMIMKQELQTDSVLVREYVNGNENALSILVYRHKQKIYSFIYSKVLDRDVTEDIFQDTFLKVSKLLNLAGITKKVNSCLG
jgi:RNA polymerase sigma-70 factor (ECF subfamily)